MTHWPQDKYAELMPGLDELIGASCNLYGVIEEIADLVVDRDLDHTIHASKFKVRLETGQILIVPGSALTTIRLLEAP